MTSFQTSEQTSNEAQAVAVDLAMSKIRRRQSKREYFKNVKNRRDPKTKKANIRYA